MATKHGTLQNIDKNLMNNTKKAPHPTQKAAKENAKSAPTGKAKAEKEPAKKLAPKAVPKKIGQLPVPPAVMNSPSMIPTGEGDDPMAGPNNGAATAKNSYFS